MIIVFCSDPLDPRLPDQAYEAEVSAVEHLGIEYTLVSYEALVYEGDASTATRRVRECTGPELAVFRGWMMRPEHYTELFTALGDRGVRLINDPMAYRHVHYLPESYEVIVAHTPRSVWLRTDVVPPTHQLMELLYPFDSAPLVLKDFVKSRKHEWAEAAYIHSASDPEAVERVVRRFLDLQGEDLNEGLVFREYVEFEPLATHSKSGMPLTKEYRIFILDGEPLYSVEYWEEGDYEGVMPPTGYFADPARAVRSRFFTMDIAQRRDGEWMIVGLGEAQVAGLPDRANVLEFYETLQNRLE